MKTIQHKFRSALPELRTILPALLFLTLVSPLPAQQQFQGWCAPVKMEILQEMTLERIGFEATLTITNNQGQDAITDFFAELTFEDPSLSENGTNDASDLFFVRKPTMTSINAVDGTGVIGASKTATIRWFIIPKPTAGGTNPNGKQFRIGARLGGKLGGTDIPEDQMFVIPDIITVRPEPQLDITYFLPRDVQGDDPFTPEVEPPVPFTLGVLVTNSGFGIARNVVIKSEQPKIVENVQALLLVAQLLGARVMDSPLDRASLTVNLGDIYPGETRKGAWDMITTLSGEFTEFKATYTHASDLGGEETSLIKSLNAHFFVQEVMNDEPGRDDILDFLAVTDRNEELIPDALYESDGNILFVNHQKNVQVVSPLNEAGIFQIRLNSEFEGWSYMRLDDPGRAELNIIRVTRSDGKVLHPRNVWTNIRYERGTNRKLTYLNILDRVDVDGVYDYELEYRPPEFESNPPVTELHFAGDSSFTDGRYYITRDTQIYFTAEDESPVTMHYSLNEAPFVPALPFRLNTPGEYLLDFYSKDIYGNIEETQRAILVLPGHVPASVEIALKSGSLFHSGEALSIRSDKSEFSITGGENPVDLFAEIAIFSGVRSFPTVANVPPSPTPFTSASLIIGGDQVDFYKYKIGSDSWSPEQPVSDPIALGGLSGEVKISVIGRSRFGAYSDDPVIVEWKVDPAATPFEISGLPATPTRSSNLSLDIGGSGISHYRWTIDDGYFRAEEPVSESLVLSEIDAGKRKLSLIAKQNGNWQETDNASNLVWTIDPLYGSDFNNLEMVFSDWIGEIQDRTISYSWNGRDNGNRMLPAGIYTVRVIATDTLGRSSVATSLIRIENLADDVTLLTTPERAAENPHAKGDWAVWQDRATGTWNIVGQKLGAENAVPAIITTGTLSQENPYTDGRYVVWQGRSESGAWDIWMRDLETTGPAVRVTSSATHHDTNPAIDWPWIVYETRPINLSNAVRQLRYHNLITNESMFVDPTSQNQLFPDIHAGRVVWQDQRNVGSGDIHFADLETGETKRITANEHGQFNPKIQGHWIVWQDNRNTQVDLYGFHLLQGTETRLTSTSHNETRPFIQGDWVIYEEDSAGANINNLRMLNLENLREIPVTNSKSDKGTPALAAGFAVWQESGDQGTTIRTAALPALQALFANNNAIPISTDLAARYSDVFSLLTDWQSRAGIDTITRYPAIETSDTAETAKWSGGSPTGDNFTLETGDFLWVRFNQKTIADYGLRSLNPITLPNGNSVIAHTGFPPGFDAQKFVESIGGANIRAIRMLDSEAGRWHAAEIRDGTLYGHNFQIPEVAVIFVETTGPVENWSPGGAQ